MQDTLPEIKPSIDLQIGEELAYSLAYALVGYGTQCYLSPVLRKYYTGVNAPSEETLKKFDAVGRLLCLQSSDWPQLDSSRIMTVTINLGLTWYVMPLDLAGMVWVKSTQLRMYEAIGEYLRLIPKKIVKKVQA